MQAGGTRPEGRLEQWIAEIWQAALDAESVGVDVNFFDVGGDSLRLTRVVARLRAELSPTVNRLDMFRHPTIRAMARYLAADGAEARPPVRDRPAGRDRALLGARRRRTSA